MINAPEKSIHTAWSIPELRVIHTHYRHVGTAGCAPMLPGRSATSIRAKAQDLDIRYDYKAAARRRTEVAYETGARPEPTWRAPQPRFASVWAFAAGATA